MERVYTAKKKLSVFRQVCRFAMRTVLFVQKAKHSPIKPLKTQVFSEWILWTSVYLLIELNEQ